MKNNSKYIILISIVVIIIIIILFLLIKKSKKELFGTSGTNIYSYKNIYKQKTDDSNSSLSSLKENSTSKLQDLIEKVNNYNPLPDGKDSDGNIIKHADEVYLKICCQLALRAVSFGNFGIGCLIVDPDDKIKSFLKNAKVIIDGKERNYLDFIHTMLESFGYKNIESDPILNKIVGLGLNMIFYEGWFSGEQKPHVRSDRHGEMVAMDLFEDAVASVEYQSAFQSSMPAGLTLYTQLESCPMCMSRLASSSISAVHHGAPDNGGGMVHKLCDLPPIFIGLTSTQKFQPAFISGSVNGKRDESLISLCFECFGINVVDVGTKQNNRSFGCPDNCPQMEYCRPETDSLMFKRAAYDQSGWTRYN